MGQLCRARYAKDGYTVKCNFFLELHHIRQLFMVRYAKELIGKFDSSKVSTWMVCSSYYTLIVYKCVLWEALDKHGCGVGYWRTFFSFSGKPY